MKDKDEKEVLLIAKGRVQGVGFRWFVRDKAIKIGVKGYVMNLPNGDVEILAQGEEEKIREFMKRIRVKEEYGPFVEDLILLKESRIRTPYKSFFIRRK